MDLYTFGTPNGFKASIALEELGLPYKVHRIDIHKGDQSTPEYIKINPNSKIPALVDDGFVVFESVAILIYLAEKTGKLMPKDPKGRSEVLQWCLFQAAGVGPMFGQYGHFAVYAREKVPYAIERYGKEVARLLGVLNDRLEKSAYLGGTEYSIADITTWPWIRGYQESYKQTLDESLYPHVARWYKEIAKRPAVQKGLQVPG